jgi:hypothetical protein
MARPVGTGRAIAEAPRAGGQMAIGVAPGGGHVAVPVAPGTGPSGHCYGSPEGAKWPFL